MNKWRKREQYTTSMKPRVYSVTKQDRHPTAQLAKKVQKDKN